MMKRQEDGIRIPQRRKRTRDEWLGYMRTFAYELSRNEQFVFTNIAQTSFEEHRTRRLRTLTNLTTYL
jgi:hypothetical protein